MSSYPNERECEHGQLRRSCDYCEYERDIKKLSAALDLLSKNDNWIQIEDRSKLKTGFWYMVQSENSVLSAYYSKNGWSYANCDECDDSKHDWYEYRITHYQPLPEARKQ